MMMMMDKLATSLLITLYIISLNIRPSPADEIPTPTPNHEERVTTSVEKESVDVTTAPNDAGTKASDIPVTNLTIESSNQAGRVPDSTLKTSLASQTVPPEIASPAVPLQDSNTEPGSEAVPAPNVQSSTNSDSAPIARTSEKEPQSNSQPPPVVPQSNSQPSTDVSVPISQPTPVVLLSQSTSQTSPVVPQSTSQTPPVVPQSTSQTSPAVPQSNSQTSPAVPQSNSQPSLDLPAENPQPNQTSSAEDLTKEPPRSKPARKDNNELVTDEIFNMETTPSNKPYEELEPINATSNEITYNNVSASYENFTEVTEINERVDEDKYVYLIFGGDCDPSEISSRSEVEVTDFAERKDTLENGTCKRQIILKMTFLDEEAKDLVKSMVGKMGLNYEKRPMKLVEVNATFEYTVTVENGTTSDNYLAGLSYAEFVSYVVIASCFGSVVLIGVCLLCLKCCWCCRDKNELMTDIPHLTLRLEDYALTRIPRPNTVYSESSKCPIMMADDASTCNASVQGQPRSTDGGHVGDGSRMSRAYDTEVVPLDDYENPYATPGYHHNGIHNGNEMRTFRRQMDQSSQGPPPNGPSRERVAFNNDSSSVTDSTEKLARDFYRRKGGGGATTPDYARENPNFNS